MMQQMVLKMSRVELNVANYVDSLARFNIKQMPNLIKLYLIIYIYIMIYYLFIDIFIIYLKSMYNIF